MACFEDLSNDDLFLILQYVCDPTAHMQFITKFRQLRTERSSYLRCLRLVSKRLKSFAESVLYKNIMLDDNEENEMSTYRFIERLSDPTDDLSRHVRSLQVTSFKGDDESFCMNTDLLVSCLNGVQKLDSIR
jgi:hypothetical protein